MIKNKIVVLTLFFTCIGNSAFALLSDSKPAKDLNECKSYVRMDVGALQNGNNNDSMRYIIPTSDDNDLKRNYKQMFNTDLNAKSNATNIGTFVDDLTEIYCEKFKSSSDDSQPDDNNDEQINNLTSDAQSIANAYKAKKAELDKQSPAQEPPAAEAPAEKAPAAN